MNDKKFQNCEIMKRREIHRKGAEEMRMQAYVLICLIIVGVILVGLTIPQAQQSRRGLSGPETVSLTNNEFAIDPNKSHHNEKGNVFISPHSIFSEVNVRSSGRYPITTMKKARFTEAWEIIHSDKPDYQKALDLLEQNIEEYPYAGDLDYEYGWGTFCCVHLGMYDRTLSYYRHIRTHYDGWLTEGAGGAMRNWDDKLAKVRNELLDSDDPEAASVLETILIIDKERLLKFRRETINLIKRANSKHEDAAKTLKHRRYHEILVDLIEEGILVVSDEKEIE